MDRRRFENLARRAVEELPAAFLDRIDNVDVVIEDLPTRDQLIGSGLDESELLLGLYEGIPPPDAYGYDLVLPDKMTLFQRAIESVCATDDEIQAEVRATVVSQMARHFGIDDEALRDMGVSR